MENIQRLPFLSSLGNKTTDYGGTTKYEGFHPGIDVANKKGTPIPSMTPGKITKVVAGKRHGQKGFGNQVEVTDPAGNRHIYSHLDRINGALGQNVPTGAPIATMGDSGSTYSPRGDGTGPHLDYRIANAYNKYMNPYQYFNKR